MTLQSWLKEDLRWSGLRRAGAFGSLDTSELGSLEDSSESFVGGCIRVAVGLVEKRGGHLLKDE